MGRVVASFLVVAILVVVLAPPVVAADKVVPVKVTRHVRYSGTGWGWITPLLFAGSRAVEALQMDGASGAERWDHATKWAKNPRFWGAVAADITAVALAEKLVTFLPIPAFFRSTLVCLAGFGVFEGVYGGFDQIDWGTLLFQSLVLTGVEMAMVSLGFGGLATFAASFLVCMLLDKWDGFDGSEEDDDAYLDDIERSLDGTDEDDEDGTAASGNDGIAALAPTSSSDDAIGLSGERDDAYRRMIASMRRGDEAGMREGHAAYLGAQGSLDGLRRQAMR